MSNEDEAAVLFALPQAPIHRLTQPFARFLHIEAASGVVLLGATLFALVLANSPWAGVYDSWWKTEVILHVGEIHFDHSLKHLINDGLMAIFFFVIGLEVKRELVLGELREMRRAALPIAAALGGMVVPAGLFLALQYGTGGARGWGIPMATDIAFVVGCMAVLGSRVPHSLRVLMLSLAIADDIGAILVIAVGYTEGLSIAWLCGGAAGIAVVFVLARLGVRSFLVYTVAGTLIWISFHESGVHATLAGVVLGLMTPARAYVPRGKFGTLFNRATQIFHGEGWETHSHRAERVRQLQRIARETISPLEYLESLLHPWVGFVIMPIFALANAGVAIEPATLASPLAVTIMLGLVVGKPLGIVAFSWIAVKLGLAQLPPGVGWRMVVAGGFLAGIGFTMALFIAGLALDKALLDVAKIGILGGSLVAAAIGMGLLVLFVPPASAPVKVPEIDLD